MNLDKQQLLQAYRIMRRIREFETRISYEFAAGTVPGMTHLYIGQEAVAAGICLTLSDEDYIASTHRGHGHCIAKGCDIAGMALELFRKEGGLCKGKGGSMHIADVSKGMLGANAIVGGASPLACGAALTAKTRGKNNVAVAFAGDGATNQGTTFEAMNMAVVLKLPVIFAIESNGYGEHTGSGYAQGNDLTERSAAFGMAAVKVDGTDFFAVYQAMQEAIARANRGEGPTAIECVAMRWHGHFEGDPQHYRPKDEVKRLRDTADPLKIFRDKVLAKGDLVAADLDQLDEEILTEVTNAVDAALEAPQPAPEELLTDVYVSY
ncbi:thiamine pyrophosphate-dependent dehydrogenase E1 component subunit alpha [Pseudomaricurvus alkylphenolicus]|uniref:thiamine pyrophosphate-dependent dehydrogenase E1 component subunit alpha n=1 Tax=Pseudomaricurvus alkylphenolicus TaxID=1306991 RepID=UPI0030B8C873